MHPDILAFQFHQDAKSLLPLLEYRPPAPGRVGQGMVLDMVIHGVLSTNQYRRLQINRQGGRTDTVADKKKLGNFPSFY
jgi:hypothetical protein